MLLAVVTALLATSPPLVPAPEFPPPLVPAQPKYLSPARVRPARREPLPPARLGLYFAPLSLFSASLWVEGELALGGGLDLFANVGGGALGQFGFDLGLRYYVNGSSLDGFYVELRGSGFSLPANGLWMLGPGLQIGHSWRIKRFTLSIALGATTWYGVRRANPSSLFLGLRTTDAEVLVLPGFAQPPTDRPAVQPTIRVALGPWF